MLEFTESELLLLRKVQRTDLPAVQEYRSEFLENEVIDPRNGDILLRYWISLTK